MKTSYARAYIFCRRKPVRGKPTEGSAKSSTRSLVLRASKLQNKKSKCRSSYKLAPERADAIDRQRLRCE